MNFLSLSLIAVALTARYKPAPIEAGELVRASDAVVYVVPGRSRWEPKVIEVLVSKYPIKKGSTILIQSPSREEGVISFDGVKHPTIVFLKNSKTSKRGWPPTSYPVGWIVVTDGKTVPYDVTNIGERRLYVAGSTYFSGSFRPRNRYFATKREVFQELIRLSRTRPATAGQTQLPSVLHELTFRMLGFIDAHRLFSPVVEVHFFGQLYPADKVPITYQPTFGEDDMRYILTRNSIHLDRAEDRLRLVDFLREILRPLSELPLRWSRVRKASRHIPVAVEGYSVHLASNGDLVVRLEGKPGQERIREIYCGYH